MNFTAVGIAITIGIVQGLISIALIQFSSARKQKHNQVLSLILMVLSFTLLPTFFGQWGLINRVSFLLFTPLDFSLFLFPLLFFYFSTVFNKLLSKRSILPHLIVPFLFWAYFFVFWLLTLTGSEIPSLIEKLSYFEVQTLSQGVWIGMVLFYSNRSLSLLNLTKVKRLSASQTRFIPWLKFLVALLMITSLLEMIAIGVGKYYGYWNGSPIDEWLGMSFMMLVKMIYAGIIYLIAFIGYAKYRTISYSSPNISSEKVDSYLKEILFVMETDQKYLNPDLKLSDLALALNTSQVYVSSLLNNELNLSFNDFVNRYRVEEVKSKLQTEAINKYTLMSLAKDAGFKSKTTFYRAFQKATNQSLTAAEQRLIMLFQIIIRANTLLHID